MGYEMGMCTKKGTCLMGILDKCFPQVPYVFDTCVSSAAFSARLNLVCHRAIDFDDRQKREKPYTTVCLYMHM